MSEITFDEKVHEDGRLEVGWATTTYRDWQRILTLVKGAIPQNGRTFQKDKKSWVIAAQYRNIFENIKQAVLTESQEMLAEVDQTLNDEALANLMQTNLRALPPSMRRRANFAIKAALGYIDAPVEFCVSEGVFAAWNAEEGVWCYETGRYSSKSPSERDDKVISKAYKRLEAAIEKADGAIDLLDQDQEIFWKLGFRRKMLEAYGYRCYTCDNRPSNMKLLHMHRVTPGSAGGLYTEDNVVLLCINCHRRLEGESWEYIRAIREANGVQS